MRPVIKLELIADDFFWHKSRNLWAFDRELRYMRRLGPDHTPSWAARLAGLQNDMPVREYLSGVKDYTNANSTGSRGIFCYYPLRDGLYEINDRYHWNKVRHYYLLVCDGKMQEIGREEAIEWLNRSTKSISE
jgi:hypothetical protein